MLKHILTAVALATTLAGATLLSGCTQLPTEKQSVSDMRPQISFKAVSQQALGASVLVDGLNVGAVGNFLDGAAAVRVLPGTHQLTVILGNQVLLQEKFYIGDGVSRSFTVQ